MLFGVTNKRFAWGSRSKGVCKRAVLVCAYGHGFLRVDLWVR